MQVHSIRFFVFLSLLSYSIAGLVKRNSYGVDTVTDSQYISIPSYLVEEAEEGATEYDELCIHNSKELYEHALYFLDSFIFPNNTVQAVSINSTVFAEDVVGRIDITRNYVGRELNTEYLFGLFVVIAEGADTSITNIFGYGTAWEVQEFIGNCNQYVLGAMINATFPLFGNISIPFQIDLYVKLNADNQITQYDLKFPHWQRFFSIIQDYGVKAVTNDTTAELSTETLPYLQTAIVESICNIHELYCQEDYPQYKSFDDCLEQLFVKRFGESWEGGRDTVFCRSLHQNMLKYRPSVHCPHIGPSGGDMCTNEGTDYEEVLFNYKTTFPDTWIYV